MILLDGQSLRTRDWFPVESMPLNLEERNSSATITVGPEAPEVTVKDWLRDDTEPGAGIVWRVKSVRKRIDTKTRTIQLEHVIQSLKDVTIFGEIKPEDMGGSRGRCTARQAITWALGRQGIWRLGDLAENPSNPYSFNGETVFAAVEAVTASIEGAQWEFDLSSMPFTLHIRKAPAGFSSEMRMSRNITTLDIQIDKSRMYTRHYPIGKNNLHVTGDYVSRNEDVWGRVDKTETDQSQDTEEKLRAWSLGRLKNHCEPLVTVTVGGLDLSRDTGEPLDHIVVGRACRLPLPEYGTTITEKVKKISWADKIREPEKVTVTMANDTEDVASIVNQMAASIGRSARAGAKKGEEDHAWIVDTTEKVEMVAEAVAGKDGDGADWSRVATLTVDGKGIDGRVTQTEGEIVTHAARLTATERAIVQEVIDRSNRDRELGAQISVEAGRISQVVQAVGQDGQVTAASIVLAINASDESVAHIDAQKVYIGNQKSTTVINGKISLSDVTAAVIQARVGTLAEFQVQGILVNGNMVFGPNSGGFSIAASKATFSNAAGQTVSTITPKDFLKDVQIVASGSGYKLQKKEAFDADWQDAGTFNRAVSLSGGWNSGVYAISATAGSISQQPDVYGRTLSDAGLGTPTKPTSGSGSGAGKILVPWDIGYSANVGGEIRRGGSTGKTGSTEVDVSSLLQAKTVSSAGTVRPDAGYVGLSQVTVSGGTGAPDITQARGGYSSKASLASSFGVSESSLTQIFSSVVIGTVHGVYAGFKCTGGGQTKYYYFYVN